MERDYFKEENTFFERWITEKNAINPKSSMKIKIDLPLVWEFNAWPFFTFVCWIFKKFFYVHLGGLVGFRLMLRWYYFSCVGIMLVVLVFRW